MFTIDDLNLIAEVFDRYVAFRSYLTREGARTPAVQIAALAVVQSKAVSLIAQLEKAAGDPAASKAPEPSPAAFSS